MISSIIENSYKILLLLEKFIKSQAPINANGIAAPPNRSSTFLSICLKVKPNLKILFRK